MSHTAAKLFLVLLLFTFAGVLQAQDSAHSRDNLAAIAKIPDPFTRMTALEEFYRRSRRDTGKAEVDRNLLLHLTDTAYQIRNFPLVLRYGEDGLARDWNNPRLKMALYFYVARACEEQGVNTGKALRYASFIEELARVEDPTRADAVIWKQFVAPAQRLYMRLRANRAKNADDWQKAVESGIFALELDTGEEAGKELYETALRARLDEHGRAAAVAALRALCRSPLARPEYLNRLAFWHSQDDRPDMAAELLITSYGMKRDPAVAYTIGKLLQKSRLAEALDYLAEAVRTGKGETATRARRLLEHLFFNVHAADLSAAEQERAFESLMQSAAQRVREGTTRPSPE